MADVILLAGLGFGDEGKGSIVDSLATTSEHQTHTVVRYNGGAQAAHNVVLDDSRHHTFAQFGSGTFAGAATHLSRHMLVNPITLDTEAVALSAVGLNPYALLTVEREALVTTTYHVAMNRLREILRGDGRHGSCGLGIGETRADSLDLPPEMVLRIGDLADRETVRKKLHCLRELKLAACAMIDGFRGALHASPELQHEVEIFAADRVDFYTDWYTRLARKMRVVDRDYLPEVLKTRDATVIFEGAQGVLLDETYGFHPYTTWTDTTFKNAFDLTQGFDGPVRKIGVLRSYMTRHGAGPFPTELGDNVPLASSLKTDTHNKWGRFQQYFRLGHFDAVLARYALEVIGGVDELVITNIDKMGPHPWLCTHYETARGKITRLPVHKNPSIDHQAQLGHDLTTLMHPVYEQFTSRSGLVYEIAEELDTPVSLVSIGPAREHKYQKHLVDMEF